MTALSPILPHLTVTQTEALALRDLLDAIIAPQLVAYHPGPNCVTHRSGRRIYRHVALETLAFQRAIAREPSASQQLIKAAIRASGDLHAAIRAAWPNTEDTQ